jgi:hypothetical protein
MATQVLSPSRAGVQAAVVTDAAAGKTRVMAHSAVVTETPAAAPTGGQTAVTVNSS